MSLSGASDEHELSANEQIRRQAKSEGETGALFERLMKQRREADAPRGVDIHPLPW